jgi:hypothetical protein
MDPVSKVVVMSDSLPLAPCHCDVPPRPQLQHHNVNTPFRTVQQTQHNIIIYYTNLYINQVELLLPTSQAGRYSSMWNEAGGQHSYVYESLGFRVP